MRVADLGEFVPLFDEPGPFVSVYLTLGGKAWCEAKKRLVAAGASEVAVGPIEELLSDLGPEARGAVALSCAAGVLHFETWETPPVHEIAVWNDLPILLPLLHHRQRHIPHVVAVVQPSRADLLAVSERHVELGLLNGAAGTAPPRIRARPLPGTLERTPSPTVAEATERTAARRRPSSARSELRLSS